MKASTSGYSGELESGFTLVELIVVLVILALATAIVAPSLVPSHPEASSELPRLVGKGRDMAIRRGEMVRLQIDRSGTWQIVAEAPPGREILISGQLIDAPADHIALVFSPLGTCGPAAESAPAMALDPLTCEVASP